MRWMRLPQVEDKTGLKKSKLYAMEDFPRPIKVGRTSVWSEADVDAWMRSKMPASKDAA
jgi:predicted DNA-binding transcriptional regulator AlpA